MKNKFLLTRSIATPDGDWFGKTVVWPIEGVFYNEADGFYFTYKSKDYRLYESTRSNLRASKHPKHRENRAVYLFQNIVTVEELKQAIVKAKGGEK